MKRLTDKALRDLLLELKADNSPDPIGSVLRHLDVNDVCTQDTINLIARVEEIGGENLLLRKVARAAAAYASVATPEQTWARREKLLKLMHAYERMGKGGSDG